MPLNKMRSPFTHLSLLTRESLAEGLQIMVSSLALRWVTQPLQMALKTPKKVATLLAEANSNPLLPLEVCLGLMP